MSHVSQPRDRRPGGNPSEKPPAGLPTRAALAIAVVLILSGTVGAGVLAGGAPSAPPVVAGTSPSAVALATETLSPVPSAAAPSATQDPGGSDGPGTSGDPAASAPPSAEPTATPTPRPSVKPVAHGGPIPATTLQARLDQVRARLKLPGVTVAIVWDDGREWTGASGQRNVAANEPMTTDTAVGLASISKTLTAAVVLELVDEGRITLDQPVAPELPEYKLHPRITVRNLLDHTSGLPDYFLNAKIDRPLQRAPDATWTAADAWRYVPTKRPAPNRFWIYSNTNYLLLGELVQKVTGRPLPEEIRTRLLDPLGLDTMWYQAEEQPRADGTVGYRIVVTADGRTRFVPVAPASDVMPFRSVVAAAGGAGSIAATALDTARWMRAWAGGELLSPSLESQVLGDMAVTRKLRSRIPYGLGIQAVPIAGHYALGHSGRYIGIRNVARYLPGEGVTIAVLTNQGIKDPARVATALLKVILPPRTTPRPGASPSPKP